MRLSRSVWLPILLLGGCLGGEEECETPTAISIARDPEFAVSWVPACLVEEIDIRSASDGHLAWRAFDVRPPVGFDSGTVREELESGTTYEISLLVGGDQGQLLILAQTTFVEP